MYIQEMWIDGPDINASTTPRQPIKNIYGGTGIVIPGRGSQR